MLGWRLSAAPSIWNDEVATPKRNPGERIGEPKGRLIFMLSVVTDLKCKRLHLSLSHAAYQKNGGFFVI
jgi:hypothetical protein